MTMMDDGREVIGAFLRYRGHSLNSTDPQQLAKAKADAIEAKKQLKAYISAPVKAQLISGDVLDLPALERRHHPGQGRAAQPRLRDPQGRVHHLGRLDVRAQERPQQAGRARVDELHPPPRSRRGALQRHRLRHAQRRGREADEDPGALSRPRTSSSGWSTRWIWARTRRPGTRSGRRSSRLEPATSNDEVLRSPGGTSS